jgi:hypothetical protein
MCGALQSPSDSGTVIRELKEGYATGKSQPNTAANTAFFQITLLAYNLLTWFADYASQVLSPDDN